MTEVERYKKLRLDRENLHGRLVGLPQKINALNTASTQAADEAVRLELLGSPEASGKRAAIKTDQDEITRLEAEARDLQHRLRIMGDVMTEVRRKADAELGQVHLRTFAKAVKNFATALRAAHEAELELVDVKDEAARAFGEIDSNGCPLPSWEPVLVRDFGTKAVMSHASERFIDTMKGQGYDVN